MYITTKHISRRFEWVELDEINERQSESREPKGGRGIVPPHSDCSDSEFDHTTIKNSGLETVSLDRDESAATAGFQKTEERLQSVDNIKATSYTAETETASNINIAKQDNSSTNSHSSTVAVTKVGTMAKKKQVDKIERMRLKKQQQKARRKEKKAAREQAASAATKK